MAGYNAVVGLDQDAANTFLSELFDAIKQDGAVSYTYDKPQLQQFHVQRVTGAITQPPIIDFRDDSLPQTPAAVSHLKAAVGRHPIISKAPLAAQQRAAKLAIEAQSQSTFTLKLPALTITIEYMDLKGKPQASTIIQTNFAAALSFVVDRNTSPPSLKPQALWGQITTDEVALEQIINESVIPTLCDFINKQLMDGIKLNPIQPIPSVSSFEISFPEPVVENNELLGFIALGATPPPVPAPFRGWPAGLFAAVDATMITTAANAEISTVKTPTGGFSWHGFGGEYDTHIGQLRNVRISQDSTGNLTAAIDASGHASFGFSPGKPFPSITIGASINGSAEVTANAHVASNELYLNVRDIHWNLSVAIDNLPSWVNEFFSFILDGIEDFFEALYTPILDAILKGIQIPIVKLPTITVPLPNSAKRYEFAIDLNNLKTEGVNPTGNDVLLCVYGMPKIVPV